MIFEKKMQPMKNPNFVFAYDDVFSETDDVFSETDDVFLETLGKTYDLGIIYDDIYWSVLKNRCLDNELEKKLEEKLEESQGSGSENNKTE
jgi:hypothetical protein